MNTCEIALRAFETHARLHPLTHYTGILSFHGLAYLSLSVNDTAITSMCRSHVLPFVRGERRFAVNFQNYLCGGNGAALLLWQGALPEAAEPVHACAEELLYQAPRDADGIVCMPTDLTRTRIWIDAAFAVTPFLLFAGLAFGDDRYIEEAWQQSRKMVETLRDEETGLLHQCRGFRGPGLRSLDHWSRGNGWALLALADLAHFLPVDDPRRPAAERLFCDLVLACLRYQDDDGLWHQELTNRESYVETSGSGLILYALGVAIEQGLLPTTLRTQFSAGLAGYQQYIGGDGAVYHTCRGCLCPGDGSQQAYEARGPLLNDPHAFGPVTFAFAQALRLGITELHALQPQEVLR
jgi:unsaturated rhamnogalacturonyl hydrolase